MKKIAIVHDQIQEFGGAERVLLALHEIFPEAPVYTAFYTPTALGIHAYHFAGWDIRTSWADKVPFLKNYTLLSASSLHFFGKDLILTNLMS